MKNHYLAAEFFVDFRLAVLERGYLHTAWGWLRTDKRTEHRAVWVHHAHELVADGDLVLLDPPDTNERLAAIHARAKQLGMPITVLAEHLVTRAPRNPPTEVAA